MTNSEPRPKRRGVKAAPDTSEPSISTCRRGSARMSKIRAAGAAISIDPNTPVGRPSDPSLLTFRDQDASGKARCGHGGVGPARRTLGSSRSAGTTGRHPPSGAGRVARRAPRRGKGGWPSWCPGPGSPGATDQPGARTGCVSAGELPGVLGGRQIHDERRDDAISASHGDGTRKRLPSTRMTRARSDRLDSLGSIRHIRGLTSSPRCKRRSRPHTFVEQVTRESSRPATDLDHTASFGESTVGG